VEVWASGKCFRAKSPKAVVIKAGAKFEKVSNPAYGTGTKAKYGHIGLMARGPGNIAGVGSLTVATRINRCVTCIGVLLNGKCRR
jgi:hypothetical protein